MFLFIILHTFGQLNNALALVKLFDNFNIFFKSNVLFDSYAIHEVSPHLSFIYLSSNSYVIMNKFEYSDNVTISV